MTTPHKTQQQRVLEILQSLRGHHNIPDAHIRFNSKSGGEKENRTI